MASQVQSSKLSIVLSDSIDYVFKDKSTGQILNKTDINSRIRSLDNLRKLGSTMCEREDVEINGVKQIDKMVGSQALTFLSSIGHFSNNEKELKSYFTERVIALVRDLWQVQEMNRSRIVFSGSNTRYLDTQKLTEAHFQFQIQSELPQPARIRKKHQSIASLHLETMPPTELDRNFKLKDFFGHIRVIGMKGSERDLIQIEHFRKVGLIEGDFEYFPPVSGETLPESFLSRIVRWDNIKNPRGVAGCFMAHYRLLKDCKERYDDAVAAWNRLCSSKNPSPAEFSQAKALLKRHSSVLVMEDNCAFGYVEGNYAALCNVGVNFRYIMKHLPEDWDMLYLMTMWGGPPLVLENNRWLLKSQYGIVMKCYAVNHTAYAKLIQKFEEVIQGTQEVKPCDNLVAELHPFMSVYLAKKSIAFRLASKSEVTGESSNGPWQPHPS